VTLVGRVKARPEMKHTQTGKAYAAFSLATEETYMSGGEKKKQTEWHKVVVWGRLAEICSEYLDKGSLILIEGKITTRQWEGNGKKHSVTEILADRMKMLGGGRRESAEPEDDLPF
jgi:single-strand DNA-binding protein